MDLAQTPEQKAFRESVRSWVDREWPKDRARAAEAQGEYPYELWDSMNKLELHGLAIGEAYEGQGADTFTQLIVARELGRTLGYLTWVWATTSFCARTVEEVGSEAQKQRLLPPTTRGELRYAISVTEPDGGTDLLGALDTHAVRGDGGWILNGSKIWVTQAHVADYLVVIARTDRNVDKPSHGITLFLVPGNAEGVSTQLLSKLPMRSVGSCQVYFQDVFIPDDLVLGEPGRGWYALLGGLNNERVLQAATCLGIIDGILEDVIAYVGDRRAFGRPIGAFQAIQHYVADIVMAQAQSELMVAHAARLQVDGAAGRVEAGRAATMTKVVVSELGTKSADLGIQILGGMGFSMETDMQRYWRDVRLARVGPITNEMARNLIAESVGLPRSF